MDISLTSTLQASQNKSRIRCLSCLSCGAAFTPKKASRRQRYCSNACRQSAFRALKWADRYEIPDPLRSSENKPDNSNSCNGHFDGRASHIRGPARVVEREVFVRWNWRAVTSPDGVVVEVAVVR
jgi:hypothetical protein